MGSLWPDFGKKPKELPPDSVFIEHFDRHQRLDKFTDTHELLEPVRQSLRPVFRKTTPIVIDMMLDHFLAKHWDNYHSSSLESFSQQCYAHMHAFNLLPLPSSLERTRYWMHRQDWFVSYRHEDGILDALDGMARRIRFDNPIAEHKTDAVMAVEQFHITLDQFIVVAKETFQPRND